MWRAFWLMMIIIIPVIILTLVVAWRYRASGGKGDYQPDWDHSRALEVVLWGIPFAMIAVLATIVWNQTHRLDPYKPLPGADPLRVQAIALDWKWLFIYPDEGIGTVNELALPAGRPVTFHITSEVAMNSFMIPALGGQIYAMAGMETKLNLLSNDVGETEGRNMQFTGDGFSDQTFRVLSLSESDFEGWTEKVRQSDATLDVATFAEISKPSIAAPVSYYASVPDGFFASRIAHFIGSEHSHSGGTQDQ